MNSAPGRSGSACVLFHGCPKNQVDTEFVLGSLVQAGYRIISELSAADLVVVTTCGFLQSARRECEASIKRVLKWKRRKPGLKVVVAGCLVERYRAELEQEFPEIDLLAGIADMPRIPRLMSGVGCRALGKTEPVVRLVSTPAHYAYLRIADGCDNRCSYCAIPGIRGRFRSQPMADILDEARRLADQGAKELVLVAQDTTRYGADNDERPGLGRLLDRLSRIDGVLWLRLMYAHPAHLTEDVLDQFQTNPKLCLYIDLPIQHVSDPVLRRMNRPYCRADIELLIQHLRAIPDLHIRTTMIVGFPGETPSQFQELLQFIEQIRFDRLSAYTYSPEPGTPAYRLRPRVPVRVQRARLRRLMRVQARISRGNLKQLVGRELDVLVDQPGVGRTEWDAPEVDGVFQLRGVDTRPGEMVRALVTGSTTHDLRGQVVGKV
ncbi:MAG: 30S ribosomal protein S12 methylthiotransferase RimO [candidate division WOR-3 bacterium]